MAVIADVRYPIGKFIPSRSITAEERRSAILTLAEMPGQLREAVRSLDQDQMETPYREGGWTVRQVVHHLADSHMVAFHRTRMALTEDWPTVAGYPEERFAVLPDVVAPAEWSLTLWRAFIARWVLLLQSLEPEQWSLGYKHSERGPVTVEQTVMLYAWHSRHHVAHIRNLRKLQGW